MSSLATPTRGLILLLGFAGIVVTVAGLRAFAGTLGPTFLALMIVITIHPLQAAARRRGAPAWLAVLAALTTAYVVLLGLVTTLAVSMAQLATLLPAYAPRSTNLVNEAVATLDDFGVTQEQIRTALASLDLGNLLGLLQRLLGGLTTALSDLVFLLALVFFMAIDAAHFPTRLAEAAKQRPEVVAALVSFAQGTRRYLVVSTVFGLIVAVVDVAALYWLSIPLALLWGLLSFITNYIPNIGFLLGLLPPALLGLLEGGPSLMLLVILAYSVINFVIQSLIQPKFVGDAVGLSITLTFLSLVFWAWIMGPLGALLAIPLSLLAKALLLDIDPSTRWLVPLISGGGMSGGGSDGPPVPQASPAPAGTATPDGAPRTSASRRPDRAEGGRTREPRVSDHADDR